MTGTSKELKSLRNNKGFTLIEVMIAMAIMVLAFTSILAVESGSIHASARAKEMNIVAMLAKNQMIETEFKIEGKPFGEVQKEEAGKFEPPYEDYQWKTTVKELVFPGLGSLFSGGGAGSGDPKSGSSSSDNSGGGQMMETFGKLMTQFLSKAIREVTVTVLWSHGSGDQTFSLTTYWVDLTYEFKLTE